MNTRIKTLSIILTLFILSITTSCNPANDNEVTTIPVTVVFNASTEQNGSVDDGYPVTVSTDINGYPVTVVSEEGVAYPIGQDIPEGMMGEPPDPERNLIVLSPVLGAVGGVLIEEIVDAGFVPITPRTIYLADILENSQGEQVLLARRADSPKAELLPIGVFAFSGVQPGIYGLIIDMGFSEFPILQEDGSELLVIIEAGKAVDLGQIFVDMPN